jgi:hypothetical protein
VGYVWVDAVLKNPFTGRSVIKCKPVIFFEVHNKAERLAVRKTRKYGYRVIKQYGEMFILIPSHT